MTISAVSARGIEPAFSARGAANILQALDQHPLNSRETWRAVIKYYGIVEPGMWVSPWLEMVGNHCELAYL